LAQAIEASRAALEVQTQADLPREWPVTEMILGKALGQQARLNSGPQAMKFLADAESAFESVVQALPNSQDAVWALADIEHEELFRFDRAFQLDQTLVKIDPGVPSSLNFEEANLAVSNFSGCIEHAATITDQGLSASDSLGRDLIKFACQAGAGKWAAALLTQKAISASTSALQKDYLAFAGTLHYLWASPAFERGRASWVALFESAEKGDGAAMADALQKLDQVMQH